MCAVVLRRPRVPPIVHGGRRARAKCSRLGGQGLPLVNDVQVEGFRAHLQDVRRTRIKPAFLINLLDFHSLRPWRERESSKSAMDQPTAVGHARSLASCAVDQLATVGHTGRPPWISPVPWAYPACHANFTVDLCWAHLAAAAQHAASAPLDTRYKIL